MNLVKRPYRMVAFPDYAAYTLPCKGAVTMSEGRENVNENFPH